MVKHIQTILRQIANEFSNRFLFVSSFGVSFHESYVNYCTTQLEGM